MKTLLIEPKTNMGIKINIFLVLLFYTNVIFAEIDLDIHGYLSQTGIKTTKNNGYVEGSKSGSLKWTEFGINFFKDFEDFEIGAQIVSRSFGEREWTTEIDWAYGSYSFVEWLGVRIGKVRMPFQTYNEYRDIDPARTSILMDQSMYEESARDLFTAIQGASLFGAYGPLRYTAVYGGTSVKDDFRFNKDFKNQLAASSAKTNVDFFTSFLLNYDTNIKGLSFSYNYTKLRGDLDILESKAPMSIGGPIADLDATIGISYNTIGLNYFYKAWDFKTEYVWQKNVTKWSSPSAGNLFVNGFVKNLNKNINVYRNRWYTRLNRQFTEKLSAELGYSYHNTNKEKKYRDASYLRTQSLSFRYDFKENFILKLEGNKNTGYADTLELSNSYINKNTPSRKWDAYLARVTFTF
jgi:hypothetical protein